MKYRYKAFGIDSPDLHSMGDSLFQYLEIKMHQLITKENPSKILVMGKYDRENSVIADCEKNNKMFNFHRPTANIDEQGNVTVYCYPGRDYVRHYASLIQTYMNINKRDVLVEYDLPSEEFCSQTIENSNFNDIPVSDVAIVGFALDKFTDNQWTDGSPYLWATDQLKNHSVTYVGCHYSYWSDAGGRFVYHLAKKGFKRIIYVGKLGAIQPEIVPNEYVTTGNMSSMEDEIVTWKNVFENVELPNLIHGQHCNCPGVVMETKEWLARHSQYHFVDSELGQMAKFAQAAGVEFSYFHFVSDNVVKKYDEDLSNERIEEIIQKRKAIIHTIKEVLYNME
ncbi:hypothetical protein [Candidatus Uabimicrobium sp. HlEnr_7]|uniref:hypothetical protein n=1 Tax=Candidatus Uabimicrobium helgolandensis TaxID=3095367 RepID=UPI003555D4D4